MLQTGSSSNDDFYKIDIYELVGTSQILISSTDWLEGPAERYCIKTKEEKDGSGIWFGGFKPNTNYRAFLSVKNECNSVDVKDIYFTTPSTNCNVAANNISVSPNPAFSNITINYNINTTSYIQILHAHSIYGVYNDIIEYNPDKSPGSYSINYDIASWYSGINYIVIQIEDKV